MVDHFLSSRYHLSHGKKAPTTRHFTRHSRKIPTKSPDSKQELPRRLAFRTRLVYGGVFLSFAALVVRMGYLQIVEGPSFRAESTTSSRIEVPVLPARGWIYDRNGNLLAYDSPTYSLYLTRMPGQNDQAMARILSPWFHMSVKRIVQLMHSNPAYATIRLFQNMNQQQLAMVEENRTELPGLNIMVDTQRVYPDGDLAGQVIGYVGSITPQNQSQYKGYLPIQSVGETGLEQEYERWLQGQVGYKVMAQNSNGTLVRGVGYNPKPKPGDTLQLTLDGHLQADAQEQLWNIVHSSGYSSQIQQAAAVVLNVHTGGVLAMVSYPYLDPNWYTNGSWVKHANYLNTSGAQMNYAIQMASYPGSTAKPANLITALKYGAVTPSTTIYDTNWLMIGNTLRHGDAAEGQVGVLKAVAVSDDIFFYHLGLNLGKWLGSTPTTGGAPPAGMGYQTWLDTDFARGITRLFYGEWEFGLGRLTGIDLPGEQKGQFYIEDSQQGYREVPFNLHQAQTSLKKHGSYVNHGTPVDLAFASIGQSQQFTPIELAQYVATIANGGKRIQPHLLSRILPPESKPYGHGLKPIKPIKVIKPVVQANLHINPKNLTLTQQGMWGVCNLPYGTAYGSFYNAPFQAAGKTGTAQIYMNGRQEYNSVFIGYAPFKHPQIAVAVMVPGAGYGSQTAVPLARQLMDDYFQEHHEFYPKSQWQKPSIPQSWRTSTAYQAPERSN